MATDHNFKVKKGIHILGQEGLYLESTNTRLHTENANALRIETGTGYVDLGSMNSGWVHMQMNRNLYILPSSFVAVDGNLQPYSDSARTLGANDKRWSHAYADNVTVTDDVTIGGDLTVTGTTTTTNQNNLDVADNIIGLNRGAASNANDSGFIIERGSTGDNASIIWDESADEWVFSTTAAVPSATGNLSITPAPYRGKGLWTTSSSIAHWGNSDSNTEYGTLTWDSGYAYIFARNSADLILGGGGTGYATAGLKVSATNKVLVNGADDNGGKADFAVDTGGSSAQVSLHGGQIQAGSTDMNWNAKFAYVSGGNVQLAAWDDNLDIFTQGGGSATAKYINLSPQGAGGGATEVVRVFGGHNGTGGVGIHNGTANLSRGDLHYPGGTTDNIRPRLHVTQMDVSGSYPLIARFQAGGDADNTGGAILINHSNDRGFLLEGGRSNSDRGVGYLGVVNSGGDAYRIVALEQNGSSAYMKIGDGTLPNSHDTRLRIAGMTTGGTGTYSLRVTDGGNNSYMYIRDDGVISTHGSGYLYVENSQGMYVTNSIKARGGISNDQGSVLINDDLVINGDVTVGDTAGAETVQLFVGSNDVTADNTGLTFTLSGTYSDGRFEHRFRKRDEGGGIPLYIDKTSATANAHAQVVRFGSYTNNSDEFEVYGTMSSDGYRINNTAVIDSSRNITAGTISGTGISTGANLVDLFNDQNGTNELRLDNNRQDLGNVPVSKVSGRNSVEVANMTFYRGSGGNTGYIRFQTKYDNSSSLTDMFQIGSNTNAYGVDVKSGGYRVNGTEVITASSNLTNIGTISSGNITASGSSGAIITAEHNGGGLADDAFIGGFLFKNNDTSGTEPHYAGMTARAVNIYGSMQLEFFADRADYESDTPGMVFRTDGTDSAQNTLDLFGSTQINNARSVFINGANDTYNFKAFGQDTDSWFGVYDDANNSANIILTRSDSAEMFKVMGHTGSTTIAGAAYIGGATSDWIDSNDELVVNGRGGFKGAAHTAAAFGRYNSGYSSGENGGIIDFLYGSGGIGSIGAEGGDSVYMQGGTSSGAGLLFHGGAGKLLPVRNAASIDATIDLGQDSRRFKDAYFSGNIRSGGMIVGANEAFDTTNLALHVHGNQAIERTKAIFLGVTGTNYNSWQAKLHNSGSTFYLNAQTFQFDNTGYGSDIFFLANSSGIDIKTGALKITSKEILDVPAGFCKNFATSHGWRAASTISSAPGYYGGNFGINGSSSENEIIYSTLPDGSNGLVWNTPSNDATSDADGGWNKNVNNLPSDDMSYMSVVYVRRNGTSTSGNFYHGCSGSHTLNTSGTANTNPYFKSFGISTLPQDVWCVSIGFIRGNSDSTSGNSYAAGCFRCDTGELIEGTYTDFRMKDGSTEQTHRTYLYYSTATSASLSWAKPGFYAIDGTEPTLQDLISPAANQGATFNNLVRINSTNNSALYINGNSGGLRFQGGNNRIYFNGYRALEGATDGGTLQVGEGYSLVKLDGTNTQLDTSAKLYFNGGTTYGIGAGGHNYNSGYFDTVESGTNTDVLELCYYSGTGVRVGTAAAHKYLYAGAIRSYAQSAAWDANLRLYSSDATNYWNILCDNGLSDTLRFAKNNAEKFRLEDGRTYSPQYMQVGDGTTYDTNDGSWGARLNVTDSVHSKIEVSQEANSMRSYWYAHTGHDSIKFGTQTSHDVEIQRAGVTRIEATGSGAYITGTLQATGDILGGTSSSNSDGQNNRPFRLDVDRSSYMVTAAGNTWGLFWAGNSGARYGTNGNGGPGNIWSNSSNPNEFAFVGSDSTAWTVYGNTGHTWQKGNFRMNGTLWEGLHGGSGTGTTHLNKVGGIRLGWDNASYGQYDQHSIRSTYGDTYGDEITINSYNHLRFNIDSNNNDATSYFEVGHHTTDTANILMRLTSPSGNFEVDGNITAYSSSISDAKYKDNIEPLKGSLDKVLQLRGVEFDWTATSRKGMRDIGFIAQEVEPIVPEVVTEQLNGVGEFSQKEEMSKSIAYDKLVPLLVESIKEQQKEIDELKSLINSIIENKGE